ncbi:hypothetical protein JCM11641_005768 [Rhodosporidiobolus odoratus]
MASIHPIAISSSSSSSSLPPALSTSLPSSLKLLLHLRTQANSALVSPTLAHELARGEAGPAGQQARKTLEAVLDAAGTWRTQAGAKVNAEHEARGEFCHAWALSRLGEVEQSGKLSDRLEEALERYSKAAALLRLPEPPQLDSVPSVTRPQCSTRQAGAVDLAEVPAWAGEMLAEYARAQTTLAYSRLLAEDGDLAADEEKLAELLDLACRRNVQALFTPVDPLSSAEDVSSSEAPTVLGNARLIRDMASLFPFSSLPSLWSRRLSWATHVADVRFVTASLSANQLVDSAATHAQALQNPKISKQERNEVKGVLEKLSRKIGPYERTQGNVLLWLGRVMLDAVGAVYLGRKEGFQAERRMRDGELVSEEEEEEPSAGKKAEVPENDLVRETRQVLIRAAALFENAYASILRAPASSRRQRTELRLLRRLEATYLDLELLDNTTPEVLELRQQRIERALFINSRLVALGDGEEDDMEESDHEAAAEDEEDEEGEGNSDGDEEEEPEVKGGEKGQEGIASRLGRTRIA